MDISRKVTFPEKSFSERHFRIVIFPERCFLEKTLCLNFSWQNKGGLSSELTYYKAKC